MNRFLRCVSGILIILLMSVSGLLVGTWEPIESAHIIQAEQDLNANSWLNQSSKEDVSSGSQLVPSSKEVRTSYADLPFGRWTYLGLRTIQKWLKVQSTAHILTVTHRAPLLFWVITNVLLLFFLARRLSEFDQVESQGSAHRVQYLPWISVGLFLTLPMTWLGGHVGVLPHSAHWVATAAYLGTLHLSLSHILGTRSQGVYIWLTWFMMLVGSLHVGLSCIMIGTFILFMSIPQKNQKRILKRHAWPALVSLLTLIGAIVGLQYFDGVDSIAVIQRWLAPQTSISKLSQGLYQPSTTLGVMTAFKEQLYTLGHGLIALPFACIWLNQVEHHPSKQRFLQLLFWSTALGVIIPLSINRLGLMSLPQSGPMISLCIGLWLCGAQSSDRNKSERFPIISYSLLCVLFIKDLSRDPGLLLESITKVSLGLDQSLSVFTGLKIASYSFLVILLLGYTDLVRRLIHWFRQILLDLPFPRLGFKFGLLGTITGGIICIPLILTQLPRWKVAQALIATPELGNLSYILRVLGLFICITVLSTFFFWLIWCWLIRQYKIRGISKKLWIECGLSGLGVLVFTIPHISPYLPTWRFMKIVLSWIEHQFDLIGLFALGVAHLSLTLIFIIILLGIRLLTPVWMRVYSTVLMPVGHRIQWMLSGGMALTCILWSWAALANVLMIWQLGEVLSPASVYRDVQVFTDQGVTAYTYQIPQKNLSIFSGRIEEIEYKDLETRYAQPERLLIITGRDQLGRLSRALQVKGLQPPYQLASTHPTLILLSNQLREGEKDENPINRALVKQIPEGVLKLNQPVTLNHELSLVGWELIPALPRVGQQITIKLVWKVDQVPSRNWEIFVHLDTPRHRIHGDHAPIADLLPPKSWSVGQSILDEHTFQISPDAKSGTYTLYIGLYQGNTRAKITKAAAANRAPKNRINLGQIRIR